MRLRFIVGLLERDDGHRVPAVTWPSTARTRMLDRLEAGQALLSSRLERHLSTVPSVLERFSDGARRIVTLAEQEARQLGHPHIGTEHLLLGIVAEGGSAAARVLMASGATLDACRAKVAEAVAVPARVGDAGDLQFTDRAKRALERASRLSLRRQDEQVATQHILLSLLDVEGTAGQVLRGLAVDLAGVRAAVASSADNDEFAAQGAEATAAHRSSPRCRECGSTLDTALAHRVMSSQGDGRRPREFVVVYCSSCGSAIGATDV